MTEALRNKSHAQYPYFLTFHVLIHFVASKSLTLTFAYTVNHTDLAVILMYITSVRTLHVYSLIYFTSILYLPLTALRNFSWLIIHCYDLSLDVDKRH